MTERRKISQDELDGFELDDTGQLYWQGGKVLTEVTLRLPKAANWAVIIAALSTFGLFAMGVLQTMQVMPQQPPQRIEIVVKHEYPKKP